ncbi:MAG: hypothetical protein M3425_11880, partial [Actinomycetota bacterium]|nr:hypothetical protein [Actinomycetota bacterium]
MRDRAAGHAGILRGEVSRAWRTLLRRLPGWLLGNLVQICTKRRRRLLLLTSWLSGRLRLKDLIRRLPRSNTYVLAADGVRFAVFCTKVANRLLEPLVAADAPPAPLELRRALRAWGTGVMRRCPTVLLMRTELAQAAEYMARIPLIASEIRATHHFTFAPKSQLARESAELGDNAAAFVTDGFTAAVARIVAAEDHLSAIA